MFVVGMFRPNAEVAKVKTMIAPKHDDCVVRKFQTVELLDHFSDLGVDVADAGVVTMNQIAFQFVVTVGVGFGGNSSSCWGMGSEAGSYRSQCFCGALNGK